ncbi:methenyltetrahydrofolate cyclohydrolase [Methylomarinovum caldicuralii]|uniref:Methenyltetrahydrofolate cyclohydrolase n=1 Tax=Methylomarinovum caldicuralii TaxID=438856 RepID=A0AAU9C3B0_9GAMM|nr:methenyltetrahydrofolate cyclohydrolase [Methylomarinovum caldicuralii]BCX81690.1 methenyltetrahydrofolate cyclohydrolase [Methylomarinovum caldicuralii]
MFKDQSLDTFLDRLASADPTPGGGSAAAVMGAMGAALVGMVASLTVGKPRYRAVEAEMHALQAKAAELRQRLLAAIEADVAAFDRVMAAYRLPKDDPNRGEAIQAALKGATDVPLACARLCVEVIGLCHEAAEKGNPNVLSDAGVGVLAAHAALKSCAINVTVNLNAIRDPAFVAERRGELEALLDGRDREVEQLYNHILAKL